MPKTTVGQLLWPEGWNIQMFHHALLAVRQYRVPDFSADVDMSPEIVRHVVANVEALSACCGFYVFDTHADLEVWQDAPHVPRAARESIDKIYVRDYTNPARILKLSKAGQDCELLITRACRDCGDTIAITIGVAARAIRSRRLTDKYFPPVRCRSCKDKKREPELRVPVSEQIHNKNKKKNKPKVKPLVAAKGDTPPQDSKMEIEPIGVP